MAAAFHSFQPTLLMISGFAAETGKSIRWWVLPQIDLNRRSLLGRQFFDHATGLASVAYYYFYFKDTGKQVCRGPVSVSSLLTQLCTQSHRGYNILSNLYEVHERITVAQRGGPQSSDAAMPQERARASWSLQCVHHSRCQDESPNKPGIPSRREISPKLVNELVDLQYLDLHVCPKVDIQTVVKPLTPHAVSLHDQAHFLKFSFFLS